MTHTHTHTHTHFYTLSVIKLNSCGKRRIQVLACLFRHLSIGKQVVLQQESPAIADNAPDACASVARFLYKRRRASVCRPHQ